MSDTKNSQDNQKVLRDQAATHTITNYIRSVYQGRFTFLNILSQLGHTGITPENVAETRQVLDHVAFWTEELWQGRPLFQADWTHPQTIEAQRAIDYLTKIKGDLMSVATDIYSALSAPPPFTFPHIAYLAAAFGRFAYGKEHAVSGLIEFTTRFPGGGGAERFEQELSVAQEDIKVTHIIIETVKKSAANFDPAFIQGLVDRTAPLIGIFRTYPHEINQIIAPYQGGLTFELADFTADEGAEWAQMGIEPMMAGYWRAYGFTAEKAKPWFVQQIMSAPVAAQWASFGFHPDTALPWMQQGFPPPLAKRWEQEGFDATDAKGFLQKGINDPSAAKKGKRR